MTAESGRDPSNAAAAAAHTDTAATAAANEQIDMIDIGDEEENLVRQLQLAQSRRHRRGGRHRSMTAFDRIRRRRRVRRAFCAASAVLAAAGVVAAAVFGVKSLGGSSGGESSPAAAATARGRGGGVGDNLTMIAEASPAPSFLDHRQRLPSVTPSPVPTTEGGTEAMPMPMGTPTGMPAGADANDWSLRQTITRDGYSRVSLDFSPDGNRLAVGWRTEFGADGVVELYEWVSGPGQDAAWVLVSSSDPMVLGRVGGGVRMESSASVWVSTQAYPTSSLRNLVVGKENASSLREGEVSIVVEDTNAFNYDLQGGAEEEATTGENETVFVMGYPFFTPTPGDASDPEWGLGLVEVVGVNGTAVTSPPRLLYKGTYASTWMGRSVAISNDRVAIAGVSENSVYPEGGPPPSWVLAQVVDLESGDPLGDVIYLPRNFQFTCVALRGDTLAVLASYPTMEVHVFRWSGGDAGTDGTWEPLGDPIIDAGPDELDGNDVHLMLYGEDRVAFGGVGFCCFYQEEPEHLGYFSVYEYSSTVNEWNRVGSKQQSGVLQDGFGQGMAFAGDRVAVSTKKHLDPISNGNISVHLYHI